MQNSNITSNIDEITVLPFPGVKVTVSRDALGDYLQNRSAQLSALNHLLMSPDFDSWDETIRSDAKWLAANLASEVSQLVSIVTFRENLE